MTTKKTTGSTKGPTTRATITSCQGNTPSSPTRKRSIRAQREEQREEQEWIRELRARRRGARGRYPSPEERREAAFQRKLDELEPGIALGPCLFLTLVKYRIKQNGKRGRDYNADPTIRAEVWHLLRTRIRQYWPGAEAFTVIECAPDSGIHLHIVVRDAPGLTTDWIEQTLQRSYPTFEVWPEDVWGGHGLAWYLTKTLRDPQQRGDWGRYFHITSQTHEWLPKPGTLLATDDMPDTSGTPGHSGHDTGRDAAA